MKAPSFVQKEAHSMPVRFRRALPVALCAALALGCQNQPDGPYERYDAPGTAGAPGIDRVLVLHPGYAGEPAHALLALVSAVSDATADTLLAAGRTSVLLDQQASHEAWRAAFADQTLEGSAGEVARRVLAKTARRLAERHRADAVIAPAVVVREARLDGRMARWDGIQRKVDIRFPDGTHFAKDMAFSGEGSVRGTSLWLVVYTADGTRVHENIRAIELLDEVHVRDMGFQMVARRDLGRNPDLLRRAVGRALAPYITPE